MKAAHPKQRKITSKVFFIPLYNLKREEGKRETYNLLVNSHLTEAFWFSYYACTTSEFLSAQRARESEREEERWREAEEPFAQNQESEEGWM